MTAIAVDEQSTPQSVAKSFLGKINAVERWQTNWGGEMWNFLWRERYIGGRLDGGGAAARIGAPSNGLFPRIALRASDLSRYAATV